MYAVEQSFMNEQPSASVKVPSVCLSASTRFQIVTPLKTPMTRIKIGNPPGWRLVRRSDGKGCRIGDDDRAGNGRHIRPLGAAGRGTGANSQAVVVVHPKSGTAAGL